MAGEWRGQVGAFPWRPDVSVCIASSFASLAFGKKLFLSLFFLDLMLPCYTNVTLPSKQQSSMFPVEMHKHNRQISQ